MPIKRQSRVQETIKVIQRLAERLSKDDAKNPESVVNSSKQRNLPVNLDELVEELYYSQDEDEKKMRLTTNVPDSLQDRYTPEEWKNLSFEEKWRARREAKSAGNVTSAEAFELLAKEDNRPKIKKRSKLDEARLKLLNAPSQLIPELLVEGESGDLKTIDVFEDEDLADDSDDAEGPTRGLPDWVIPKNRLYRSFLQFRNELDDRTEERMLRDRYMIFDDDPLMKSDSEEEMPDKPETFHLRPLKMTEVEWDDWKKKKQIPIVRHVNPAHPMVKGRKKMTGRYGMYWEHKLKPSEIAKLRDGGVGDGDPLFLEKWSGRSLAGRRYFMADDPKHESKMAELAISTLKKEGAQITEESINERIEELEAKLRSECGVEETDEEENASGEEVESPSTSRDVQSAMSGNIRTDTTETQPERSHSAMAGVVTSPDSPSKRVLPARVRKPTVKEAERREAEGEEKRERRASRRSSDKGSRESLTTPTPSEVATTEKEAEGRSSSTAAREGSVIVEESSSEAMGKQRKNTHVADDYSSTDDDDAPTTTELMKYHKSELIVYRDRWGMPKLAPRCCLADVVEGKWRPCPRPGRNDFMSATLAKRAYEMDLNIAWRYKSANQRICQLHSRVLRNAGYGGNVLEEMMGWMGRRDCTEMEKKLVGKELTTPFDELEREETKWLNFAKPVSAQIFMQQMRDVNKEARRFAYALRDRFRGRRARRVRRVPKGEKKETRMFEWAKHCLDKIDVKALTEEEIAALSGKERRSLAELIRINKKRLEKQELQLEKMRKKQQKKEGSGYRPMTPISCESVKGTEADFEKAIGPLIECMVRRPPPEAFAHAPPIRRLSERGGRAVKTSTTKEDDEIEVVGEVTASRGPRKQPLTKKIEKKPQIATLPSGELIDATKYNEMWARVKKHLKKMKKTPESKMQAIEFLMRKKCMPELQKEYAKEERMRDMHVDLPADEYVSITLTTSKNKTEMEREYWITGIRKDPLTKAATRLRNPLIFHAVRKNDPDMKLVRLMPALKHEMLRKRNPAWKKKKAEKAQSKKQPVIKIIDATGESRKITILTGDDEEASGAQSDDEVMEVDAASRDSEASKKDVEADIIIVRHNDGILVKEKPPPASALRATVKPTLIRRVKRTAKERKEAAERRTARREERKKNQERRARIDEEREAQGLEPMEWKKKQWVDPRIALYTRPGVIVVKRTESLKKLVEARNACLEKIQNMPTLSRLLESLVREGVMELCKIPAEREITDADIEAAKQNIGEQRRREMWMNEIDRFLSVHGCLPPGVPQQYIEEREEELEERMRVNAEVEQELLYEEQRQAMWDEAGAAAAAIDKDSTSDSDVDHDDEMGEARLVGVPSSTAPVAVRTSNPRLLKLQSVYDKLKDERRYWTREEDEQWRMKRRFQPPPKPLRPLNEYEEVTPESGPTIPAKTKVQTIPPGAILMQTAETKKFERKKTGKKISLQQALRRIDTSRMTLPQMKKMIAGLKKLKATRPTRSGRSKLHQQRNSKNMLQRQRGKQIVKTLAATEQMKESSTLTPAQLRSLFEWSMAPSTVEEVAKDLREHGLDVMTASRDEASQSIIRLRKLKQTIYDELKPHGMDETKPTTIKIRALKPPTAPSFISSKTAKKQPVKIAQKAKTQEIKRVEAKKEGRTGKTFKRSEMEQRRQLRLEESARRMKSGSESTEKVEKKERRVTIVEPPKKKKKLASDEGISKGGTKRKLYVVRLKRKDKPSPTEEETQTARASKRAAYSWTEEVKEDPQADREDERRYKRQKEAAKRGREELARDSDEEREDRRKRMPERKRKHKKRKRRHEEEEREKEEEEKEEEDDEIEELDEDGNPIPKKKWRPSDPAGFSLYPMEWILRYREHFGLPTEPGDTKRQLVFGAAYHFHHVLQASSAAIPYFAHTVKTGGNPLDHIDDQALRDSIEAKRQEEIRKREELEAAGLQAPTPPPAKGTRYRVAANQRKQLIKEKEAAKKKAAEEEENSQDDSQ